MSDKDILPELIALTGLTTAEIDEALNELDRKGFIHLEQSQGETRIVLCDLEQII